MFPDIEGGKRIILHNVFLENYTTSVYQSKPQILTDANLRKRWDYGGLKAK